MKTLSEGRKMFVTVMTVFVCYGAFFIIFDDFDRRVWSPLSDQWDWHMLGVSMVVLVLLAIILHRYSQRMDKRLSRERAEKENALRRQLTQNIAHELKTPVASILGYTETLLDNPQTDTATQRQFIERTHSQAQRLTSLLQNLSQLNRMDYATDALVMERVDIAEIFAEIVEETRSTLEQQNIQLRNCLPSEVIVQGNYSLIYSVLRNLVDNAIYYGGPGTKIELTAKEQKTRWHFTFSDNGPGVPKEHLPRLFERFYRVDKGRSRSKGGTGLGLAIVKNAVLLHGGSISVHNLKPHGLCFDFSLNKKR